VKPISADYLQLAEDAIAHGTLILAINIPRQAARLAYYAQFHAAQALIFEYTSSISRTHKGVAIQFHKLVRTEPLLDSSLPQDLSFAYRFKEAADYQTTTVAPITISDAQDALHTADSFVTAIRDYLARSPTP
jgi:uncharacterized protein (UPF0332 family)